MGTKIRASQNRNNQPLKDIKVRRYRQISEREMKHEIKKVKMETEQQYCVGYPKMVAVPYTGQKEPIIVGSKKQVEDYLKRFWEYCYGKK